MDGGESSVTLWMHLRILNYTFKNDVSNKFYVMYILPQLKINVLKILNDTSVTKSYYRYSEVFKLKHYPWIKG